MALGLSPNISHLWEEKGADIEQEQGWRQVPGGTLQSKTRVPSHGKGQQGPPDLPPSSQPSSSCGSGYTCI